MYYHSLNLELHHIMTLCQMLSEMFVLSNTSLVRQLSSLFVTLSGHLWGDNYPLVFWRSFVGVVNGFSIRNCLYPATFDPTVSGNYSLSTQNSIYVIFFLSHLAYFLSLFHITKRSVQNFKDIKMKLQCFPSTTDEKYRFLL